MTDQVRALSNLEFLQEKEVLPEGITLDSAARMLTDPKNCAECIAAEQCADRYGSLTGQNTENDCLTVVTAFLKQDHKEVKKTDGHGEH